MTPSSIADCLGELAIPRSPRKRAREDGQTGVKRSSAGRIDLNNMSRVQAKLNRWRALYDPRHGRRETGGPKGPHYSPNRVRRASAFIRQCRRPARRPTLVSRLAAYGHHDRGREGPAGRRRGAQPSAIPSPWVRPTWLATITRIDTCKLIARPRPKSGSENPSRSDLQR